jgi:hypothetical protein
VQSSLEDEVDAVVQKLSYLCLAVVEAKRPLTGCISTNMLAS